MARHKPDCRGCAKMLVMWSFNSFFLNNNILSQILNGIGLILYQIGSIPADYGELCLNRFQK